MKPSKIPEMIRLRNIGRRGMRGLEGSLVRVKFGQGDQKIPEILKIWNRNLAEDGLLSG